MQEQNSSPVRVIFGVIAALMIVYGAYSLGASVMTLIQSAKAPDATTPAEKAGQELGLGIAMFAAEFGIMRGMFSLFIGFGGLVMLGIVDRVDQSQTLLAHIWRELAAKNQTTP